MLLQLCTTPLHWQKSRMGLDSHPFQAVGRLPSHTSVCYQRRLKDQDFCLPIAVTSLLTQWYHGRACTSTPTESNKDSSPFPIGVIDLRGRCREMQLSPPPSRKDQFQQWCPWEQHQEQQQGTLTPSQRSIDGNITWSHNSQYQLEVMRKSPLTYQWSPIEQPRILPITVSNEAKSCPFTCWGNTEKTDQNRRFKWD